VVSSKTSYSSTHQSAEASSQVVPPFPSYVHHRPLSSLRGRVRKQVRFSFPFVSPADKSGIRRHGLARAATSSLLHRSFLSFLRGPFFFSLFCEGFATVDDGAEIIRTWASVPRSPLRAADSPFRPAWGSFLFSEKGRRFCVAFFSSVAQISHSGDRAI